MSWNGVRERRRRGGGRTVAIVFLVVSGLLAAAITGLVFYARAQLEPVNPADTRAVSITVRDGESVDDVIHDLDAQHLIRSTFWFGLYGQIKGLGGSMQTGSHALSPSMSSSTLITTLEVAPQARRVTITFPEGLTAQQMAQKVEAAGIGVSASQYMAEEQKGAFSAPFLVGRPPGASLEGFLFPDTYAVTEGATAHDIIQMQLDAFAAKGQPILTAGGTTGLTPYQVVTLASIVEREAQTTVDRPQVASVIVNRLQQQIPLQVDATVSYGVGRAAGEPTQAELQRDTPYNTYLHQGLPPTPISNPGVESLRGAEQPAQTNYLYYVSDACHNNHYAATIEEHNANVARYVGKPCTP